MRVTYEHSAPPARASAVPIAPPSSVDLQLVEATQIACDFWNRFCGLDVVVQVQGFHAVFDHLRQNPLEHYRGRYPAAPVHSGNVQRVRELDDIVDNINTWPHDDTVTKNEYDRMLGRAYYLIYGEEHRRYTR